MIIKISDDFNLAAIIDSGQCFRARCLPDGSFCFPAGSRVLYIRPLEKHLYDASCSMEDWKEIWNPYFDLKRNYRRIRSSIPKDDHFLYRAAKENAGIRILRQDPWETSISFLISQRKSIPAIRGCIEKLCMAFGSPVQTILGETFYTFPCAERLAAAKEDALSCCSLGYRQPYIRKLSQKAARNPDYFLRLAHLNDEELLAQLQENTGIGIKVASCIALFAYGRTSVAPVDTWIHRISQQYYAGQDPFQNYDENAGILQQYAFRYAIHHKEVFLIDP